MPHIEIPAEISFADLALSRDTDGAVSFSLEVIGRIETANGLDEGFFMGQHEDAVASLIVNWYAHHRAAGGAPDPVADDLVREVVAEDAAGQLVSHKPGLA